MLFHNVLDYKLWAFEHLWAPGALKTVEERATLHSHVVPFGDAALTAGSHTPTPACLSLVIAASTAPFFLTTIHGASWGVAQEGAAAATRRDTEEGAAEAASDCENVSDTAARDDFPGLARAAGAAVAASRGPSTFMGPPPTVLSALAQLALGSDSIEVRALSASLGADETDED